MRDSDGKKIYRGPYILMRTPSGNVGFVAARRDERSGQWVALTDEEKQAAIEADDDAAN